MGDFTELFAVDSEQALQFFLEHLGDEVVSGTTEAETLYVASVLAHFAQTSRSDPDSMSPPVSLYDILYNFFLPGFTPEGSLGLQDPEILETAGAQTLLLVGFFRDQMNKRHNLEWYDNLGQSFFVRASHRSKEKKRSDLFWQLARNFPFWIASCQNVSRRLREERYLLRFDL